MADVLTDFEIDVTHDIYTITTVNFVETTTKTSSLTIKAVVQPASQERLKALSVDYSLKYKQVHSKTSLNVGEYIVYEGTSYKIITPGDYQLYGFSDVVAEEVKGAIT